MAATRTKSISTRKKSKKTTVKRRSTKKPGIAQHIQMFIARRLLDIWACILLGFGLFIFISIVSYNPDDPSWNTSASGETIDLTNWGGTSGAWLADISMQTLGFGALAICLGIIIWGAKLLKRHAIRPFFIRLAALMVSAIFFSIALAQIPAGDFLLHPYLGSSAGTILMQKASSILPFIGPLIIALIAGAIALISFLFGAAFTRDEILSAIAKMGMVVGAIAFTAHALWSNFMGWIAHYNDPDNAPERKPLFKEGLFAALFPKTEKAPKAEKPAKRTATIQTPEEPDLGYVEPKAEKPVKKAPKEEQGFAASRMPDIYAPKVQAQNNPSTQQRFALGDSENWEMPGADMLQTPPPELKENRLDEAALRKNAELLQNVLADFKVEGEIVSIYPGPVVTLYELEPAPGTKSSRIIALSDDIARSMSAISVRCAVVPGRNVIGIELPNKSREIVYMQGLLNAPEFDKTKANLPLVLGRDIGGQPIIADLARMPHLLVAGTTGSGKSVAVNTMILSLLFRLPPSKCRFIMIDPKMLELSVYDGIPHLLAPVVTEAGKAIVSLKWAVNEMEERYRAMSKMGVRNIDGYNERLAEARKKGEVIMEKVQTGFDPETGKAVYEEKEMDLTELPYIVIIVDEFADLMLVAGKDVENAIQRLAQMARAAGLHLIMATQRPSVDVITGVVKANFPTRISFQVTSKIDSRTILGEAGAEQLLGMGDMLYMAPGGQVKRVHGPFVSDDEVEDVVKFLKSQGEPAYITGVTEESDYSDNEVMNAMFGGTSSSSDVDELYDKAVMIVARDNKASTSYIQRQLQIGYNRAARIIEEMERQGVISSANATGKRTVLVSDHSGEH